MGQWENQKILGINENELLEFLRHSKSSVKWKFHIYASIHQEGKETWLYNLRNWKITNNQEEDHEIGRRKEIIKVKEKTYDRKSPPKNNPRDQCNWFYSWFYEKINTINEPLERLIRREKTLINRIRKEMEEPRQKRYSKGYRWKLYAIKQ